MNYELRNRRIESIQFFCFGLLRGFFPAAQEQVEHGYGAAHVYADGQAGQHLDQQGKGAGEEGGKRHGQQVPQQETDQQEEQVLLFVLHQFLALPDAVQDPGLRFIRHDELRQGVTQGGHAAGNNNQKRDRQGHVIAALQGGQLGVDVSGLINRQQQVYGQGNPGKHPQQDLQDDQQLQGDRPEELIHPAQYGADRILQAAYPVHEPPVHAQRETRGDQPGKQLQAAHGPESGAAHDGINFLEQLLLGNESVPGGGDQHALQPAGQVIAGEGGKTLHQQRGKIDDQRDQQGCLPVAFQYGTGLQAE